MPEKNDRPGTREGRPAEPIKTFPVDKTRELPKGR
jgi:hypothetical protein